jgi:hypothetical protein
VSETTRSIDYDKSVAWTFVDVNRKGLTPMKVLTPWMESIQSPHRTHGILRALSVDTTDLMSVSRCSSMRDMLEHRLLIEVIEVPGLRAC